MDRINWCKENEHRDWGSVVFSDETVVCTSDHGVVIVRRPKGTGFDEKYVAEMTRSGRISIACWGMMWREGLLDLVLVPTTLNGPKYRDLILDKHVKPFMHDHPDLIFQQDNASIHRCKVVNTYLEETNIEPLLWPSKSPDLNIIENVWDLLKDEIGPINHITNEVILWYVVKNAWEELKTSEKYRDYVANLYASMPSRCRATIENDRGLTKY